MFALMADVETAWGFLRARKGEPRLGTAAGHSVWTMRRQTWEQRTYSVMLGKIKKTVEEILGRKLVIDDEWCRWRVGLIRLRSCRVTRTAASLSDMLPNVYVCTSARLDA